MAEYPAYDGRQARPIRAALARVTERVSAVVEVVTAPVWGTWKMFRESAQRLRWFSPERVAVQFTYYRKICFLVTLAWTVFLWAMLAYKYFTDGTSKVLSYFTNVSLSIQLVYYTLDLVSYFGDPETRALEMWLLYSFWPAVFAQTFDVFVMVLFVYLDNANIFTENLESAGGPYDDGLVLIVERAAHVFPLFFGMIYYVLRLPDISDFLVMHYGVIYTMPVDPNLPPEDQCLHARSSLAIRRQHALCYIVYQYLVAAVPFCTYALVQNVRTVYGIDEFTNWMAVLAVAGLNLVCVVLVLYSIAFYYVPARRIPASLEMYHAYDDSSYRVQVSSAIGIPKIVEGSTGRFGAARFEI